MRRMVFLGPVVLALGALTACTNPFSGSTAGESLTASPSVTASESATATPTTTPSDDPQQTGEANPSPFVTPSRSTSSGAKPTCASVWVDEKVLPADYAGCTGDTKAQETTLDCNSGGSLWMRNEPDGSEYYAFAGKRIIHTKNPDGDANAQATCMS